MAAKPFFPAVRVSPLLGRTTHRNRFIKTHVSSAALHSLSAANKSFLPVMHRSSPRKSSVELAVPFQRARFLPCCPTRLSKEKAHAKLSSGTRVNWAQMGKSWTKARLPHATILLPQAKACRLPNNSKSSGGPQAQLEADNS